MGDNNKKQEYPKLIFKAEIIILPNGNKDIQFECKTNHIPTLDTISGELDYYITELRAIKKAKNEMAKQGIIQKASQMTLQNLLRRKRR